MHSPKRTEQRYRSKRPHKRPGFPGYSRALTIGEAADLITIHYAGDQTVVPEGHRHWIGEVCYERRNGKWVYA